jgi:RNA polymerase sigma-70 factor (ECF subfamily)
METYGPEMAGEQSVAPKEPDSLGKARLALQRLDAKLRVPLLLKEVEEMSVEEIAKTMGLTQTNVKVRLFRARKKLQSMLGGTEGRSK